MASLSPVAAGFVVNPSRERERRLIAFYRERGEAAIPLDDGLYELRKNQDGKDVVLLPLRSYDAAKRVRQAFEAAAREHEAAMRCRHGFRSL